MLTALSHAWALAAVRGVAMFLFGMLLFFLPGLGLGLFTGLFCGFVLIDGVCLAVSAFTRRDENPSWWLLLLQSLVSLCAGVLALVFFILLPWRFEGVVVVGWFLLTGIFNILVAIQLRKDLAREWMLAVNGIVCLFMVFFLCLIDANSPITPARWLIGAYSVGFGILTVFLGFKLHGILLKRRAAAK
jgi:uncharacterized membrane protein HdeD (DUF308 family)